MKNILKTGNLLDFSNHQNYYKLIETDLWRQANTNVPQQVNFVGKLEEDFDAKHKTNLFFSLDSLIATE